VSKVSVAYSDRLLELRERYFETLSSIEERYGSEYAALMRSYEGRFRPSGGDSRAITDAAARYCALEAWRPREASLRAETDALFHKFQSDCSDVRKELGL